MAKLTDNKGGVWNVEITAAHLKPLRENFGIATKATVEDFYKSVSVIVGDEEKLYDLLLLLCAVQMKDQQLDALAFGNLIGGEALRSASSAVSEALLDFYQGPNTAKEMAESIRAMMTKRDEMVSKVIRESRTSLISKLSAGKLPDSVESTPAQELSAN